MADEPAKRKPWITIAIIVLVVLVADVVGGYLIFKFAIPMVYKSDQAASSGEGKKKEKESGGSSILAPLDNIILNPANSNGEILSTEIVFETHDQSVVTEVADHEAQIKDSIITYLSYKNVQELNDVSKREQFKKDIIDRVNSLLKEGKVTGIYTKSWIIQFQ